MKRHSFAPFSSMDANGFQPVKNLRATRHRVFCCFCFCFVLAASRVATLHGPCILFVDSHEHRQSTVWLHHHSDKTRNTLAKRR